MTKKMIEDRLPNGYSIEKYDGMWYFHGHDTHVWNTTCSYFCTLNQGTVEQWLSAFEMCRPSEEKEESSYIEDIIRLGK